MVNISLTMESGGEVRDMAKKSKKDKKKKDKKNGKK
jgi:hypothetical protein